MSTACDVLLLGTFSNLSDVARDDLLGHGLSVEQVPFDGDPLRDAPGYIRTLKKALALHAPKVILPVGTASPLASCRDLIESSIAVPLDSAEKLALLENKVTAAELAGRLGIRQPRIYSTVQECDNFPVVFKRSNSVGGCGVYFPKDRAALEHLVASARSGEYLIEDFIEGAVCSVDCIRSADGTFEARCYKSLSRGKGPASAREAFDCPEMLSAARKILEDIDFRGLCGMDFIVDSGGNAWFLECNPRFTGGLKFQIESGFDIPYIYISSIILPSAKTKTLGKCLTAHQT